MFRNSVQENLKSFEYKYNPLKRDSIKLEPYHKNANVSKPLGPDRARETYFCINDDDERAPMPDEMAALEGARFPMDGFQENFALSEFFATGPLVQNVSMPNIVEMAKAPPKTHKRMALNAERKKRKSTWPSLEVFDVMHYSILESVTIIFKKKVVFSFEELF